MGQIIAPRADGEGSLGTATLHWGDVRTDKINGASIAEGGAATTSAAGLMSAEDKGKLDGVPTPTEGDAGKVLAVTEGETGYEAIPLPDPLPEISEGDAGKAVVVNDTEDGYELGDPLSGNEFETVSVTSTDDATSATAAPLKSAGGLAVAGNAWIEKSLKVGQSERHVYRPSNVYAGQSIFCTFVLNRWTTAIIDLRVSMVSQSFDAGRYAHISAQLVHNNEGGLVVRRTNLALHTFLAENIVISKPSGSTNTTVTIQIINNTASTTLNSNCLLLDIVGYFSLVNFSVGNS